jgi:hypothetical protein
MKFKAIAKEWFESHLNDNETREQKLDIQFKV